MVFHRFSSGKETNGKTSADNLSSKVAVNLMNSTEMNTQLEKSMKSLFQASN